MRLFVVCEINIHLFGKNLRYWGVILISEHPDYPEIEWVGTASRVITVDIYSLSLCQQPNEHMLCI